jgi:predicted O-methyltransferase YrrM
MDKGRRVELDALAERYYPDNGTRKHISYLAEYERILEDVRDTPLRILELGVSSGASLLMWHEYLPNATIVGIDIGERPAILDGHERIQFLRASQDDTIALDATGQANGPFDLIVDDASHIGYLTKRSFCHLYPRWLKPGGCYVIEDFGTGFLPEYPDGHRFQDPSPDDAVESTKIFTSHQYGMVGVVKQLIDHMMRELMLGTRSFLDIERLTILTNVAFIQKSARPGGVPDIATPMRGLSPENIVSLPHIKSNAAEPSTVRRTAGALLHAEQSRLGRIWGRLRVPSWLSGLQR